MNSIKKGVALNKEDVLNLLNMMDQATKEVQRIKSGDINLSKAMIFHGEQSVVFPHTIAVVQGKTGTHKSRIAQNLVSAVIAEKPDPDKTMGFRFKGDEQPVVFYVDTERNLKDQFPLAIQDMLRGSGFQKEEDPPQLKYTSMLMIPRSQRTAALNVMLKRLREKFPEKHLFVVLDVITDLVSNFNDEVESMKLTDILNEMCNRHNATIIGVIHENPTSFSTKARGHVGTELANKASTVIQVQHESNTSEGGIFKVSFLKSRSTAPLKSVYTMYDSDIKNLRVYDGLMRSKAKRKEDSDKAIQTAVEKLLIGKMSKTELVAAIQTEVSLSKDRIEKGLAKLVREETKLRFMLDYGVLKKESKRKEVFFFIQEVNQPNVIPKSNAA
jgi:hypothetical protein